MFTPTLESRLTEFAKALVNQEAATVVVAPQRSGSGHWFGGGNLQVDANGDLLLIGRYRNAGDSRTGLGQGERGLELAIFRSTDRGKTFQQELAFAKADLNVGELEVLSIEGSALWVHDGQYEMFVSTEKSGIDYPPGYESFRKPGTGVWTIEHAASSSLAGLREASLSTVVESADLQFLHVKDPYVYPRQDGALALFYCSHPFCWSSSNTALLNRSSSGYGNASYDFFPRGHTWDVAMTRGTAVLDVPRVGAFASEASVRLHFYDGGECLRNLDEHASSVRRPRGYSCEEIGGVAYTCDEQLLNWHRLSKYEPMFLSPYGTGCSRYVDVLATDDGFYATWQQSQQDESQPLVLNFLPRDSAEAILS